MKHLIAIVVFAVSPLLIPSTVDAAAKPKKAVHRVKARPVVKRKAKPIHAVSIRRFEDDAWGGDAPPSAEYETPTVELYAPPLAKPVQKKSSKTTADEDPEKRPTQPVAVRRYTPPPARRAGNNAIPRQRANRNSQSAFNQRTEQQYWERRGTVYSSQRMDPSQFKERMYGAPPGVQMMTGNYGSAQEYARRRRRR